MTDAGRRSDLPPPSEMAESVLVLISGVVIGAPMVPGFLLCVPALGMVAVLVLVPLVAVGVLVTLGLVLLAVPVVLARALRRRWARPASPPLLVPPVPQQPPRPAALLSPGAARRLPVASRTNGMRR